MVQTNKYFGVYQIKNLINNKFYVGSTTISFSQRWSQWRSDLKRNKGSCYLRASWNKYGGDAFEFSILEIVQEIENVISREQYWIDTLKPEYNLAPVAGNNIGSKRSEETRKKLSEGKIGYRNHRFGVKASEETRKKMSEGHSLLEFKLVSPEGQVIEAKGLKKFCELNNLSSGHIHEVLNGKRKTCKGWTKCND